VLLHYVGEDAQLFFDLQHITILIIFWNIFLSANNLAFWFITFQVHCCVLPKIYNTYTIYLINNSVKMFETVFLMQLKCVPLGAWMPATLLGSCPFSLGTKYYNTDPLYTL
jgi:hypothetical protein